MSRYLSPGLKNCPVNKVTIVAEQTVQKLGLADASCCTAATAVNRMLALSVASGAASTSQCRNEAVAKPAFSNMAPWLSQAPCDVLRLELATCTTTKLKSIHACMAQDCSMQVHAGAPLPYIM